ncbi:MAG: hypothetical protein ACOCUH_03235 [Bacteriovoracia bacterium]
MNAYYKSFPLFLILVMLVGCGRQVVRRNSSGNPIRNKQYDPARFAGIKKKIALLSFFNESPYGGEDLAVTATEELRREISRTGDFLIDPEGEKLFGSSKEIYSGGGMKLAQMARKAKLSGINLVVFGRIRQARIRQKMDEIGFVRQTKSYAEAELEIKAFDVSSNKEIFTSTFPANTDDKTFHFYAEDQEGKLNYRQQLLRYTVKVAARRAVPKLMKLASKMNWTGRVAKIIGSKIYVNAGRQSGLNVGDVLKVITEGREIFDPETGALLGISKGEVKGTLEIIDYFGPDGSIAILHSGGSVTEGDFVELY